MKKTILFLAIASIIGLSSCDNNNYHGGHVYVQEPNIVVTPEAVNLGDNLDLQALGELVKTANNAKDIESKLNQSGSINNLDLDGDGNVDYIKVTEYGDGNARGFSFTVDLPNSEKQEIATVELQKGSADISMNIQGNQQVYGNGAYYQSHYSLSDIMIMSYLFSYHRPYYSPYHYGYYPHGYQSYHSAPIASYRSRVSSTTKTTKITRTSKPNTSIKSPNSAYNSKKVSSRVQSLASPTKSQKAFTKTNYNKNQPKTSGFGNKSSGSYKSTPKSSYSSSSRKSSSFGSSSRSSSSRSGRRR